MDGDAAFGARRMSEMMGVRTRFFDEFFIEAANAGIRQAVILASGLDARAYRLAWPAGATVYEIDQPRVIEFKTKTLEGLGAVPTADRRAVAIDLRQDWPAALRRAGFDPAQPTAWSAEGLLAFLPPDAQDRLLDSISALSPAGSRFASENMPNTNQAETTLLTRMQTVTDRWRQHGFDLDMSDLWYPGDRNDVADYLNAQRAGNPARPGQQSRGGGHDRKYSRRGVGQEPGRVMVVCLTAQARDRTNALAAAIV